MKRIFFVTLLGLAVSCTKDSPTAQEIVDKAIEVSGTNQLVDSKASFTFRGIQYTYSRSGGNFEYARIQIDTLDNEVKDVLTNEGLIRYINDGETDITNERREAYTSSVNSVIYFAFLPASLNDAAVNKEYIGEVTINNKSYYKIKVTFDVEGGGEDYEDVFYYWFDTADYSIDYLAYSYNEKDGKGIRFRIAYNSRSVNGVTIQDYKNHKPKVKDDLSLANIDQAYINGDLEELSLIELENVEISLN